ncbi:DUF86 domain-containing protein [Melioribacteraceae bacterium 4301-Me]|uniref:type VII toxin-antitoxin system HepT family RNase toxin n=1 Tax=Pyranulibacter aquaticus TaxID=3163344 RepID=UPI00359905D5
MPDKEIIEKRISTFIADLENLKKHRNVTLEEVRQSRDLVWMLERGIYLLIQNLFDMLTHIVAADFKENWDYYTDIPEILAKHKIISKEDKQLLIQMAGFRNRLTHEYLSLDPNILVDIMHNHLADFYKFLQLIKNYCEL